MLQWLADAGSRYGYVVVFLGVMLESMGVPVPGETSLLVGAVLAGAGHLNIVIVGLVGWLGAVLGDNTGYAVGRRYGRRLVNVPLLRRVYRPEHVEAAERFFARHGWLAVFFGRFIALLRILAGPLAGMHRMPWRRFVIANGLGGASWVALVCVVGLLIGKNLDAADRLLRDLGLGGLVLAFAVGAVWIGFAVWQHRRIARRS